MSVESTSGYLTLKDRKEDRRWRRPSGSIMRAVSKGSRLVAIQRDDTSSRMTKTSNSAGGAVSSTGVLTEQNKDSPELA